jgi:phosphatidylglycerophosphatase A
MFRFNLRQFPTTLPLFWTLFSKPFDSPVWLCHNQPMMSVQPTIKNFLIQLATLFGVGKLPKGPGTWGTLATLPVAWILMQMGPLLYMAIVVLLLPVAILSAELYEQFSGNHDSKEIVIDEVIGFLITMTWLPMGWQSFVFGFLLFRLLDIWKPYPISYLDKKIQGGLGVVIDDVAAGIVANVILQLVYTKTMWLGSQVITSLAQ